MRVSQEELDKVKSAMNTQKKTRVYKRFLSLYLYLSGKTCEEVAEIVGITKTSVSRINQRYYNGGIINIADKPKKGRPPKLTNEQKLIVKHTILYQSPSDVGFPANFNWTAGLIGKFIKREFGANFTIRGITGLLKRLGLSYTRPTYVLAKADSQKQEKFKHDFKKVKKTCWMKKSREFFSVTNQ